MKSTPLVILPGALLAPPHELLLRLARSRRVLPISYGREERMTDLVDAIAAGLAAEGIGSCDLLGSSYGGWVAQCMAHRHPALVRKLILAHSFALRPSDAWRFRVGLRLWNWIPARLFRKLALARVARMVEPVRHRSQSNYERLLSEVRAVIEAADTPAALLRQNLCLLESCDAFADSLEQERLSAHRILIIESDDDPAVRSRERARLRALYPAARVHAFHGTGHVSALLEPDAFADAVEDFFDQ